MRAIPAIYLAALFGCLCSTSAFAVQADEQQIVRGCKTQVSTKFRQWHLARVPAEVDQFVKSRNESATMVRGDFDGDTRRDVAMLLVEGADPDPQPPARSSLLHIAVCLNTASGMRLYIIERPYCSDGIALSPKGRSYHDFERETEGTYRFDGVHRYCFEKAGATYQFENGAFRQIVDSD